MKKATKNKSTSKKVKMFSKLV